MKIPNCAFTRAVPRSVGNLLLAQLFVWAQRLPERSQMVEMLTNRDFFGTEIRNADDPIVQQLMDTGKYVSKQYLPFSVRNIAEQQKRGSSLKTQVGSFFGMTPAPAYINNSAAVNRAIEYGRANRGEGTRTKAQAEQSERRRHQLKSPLAQQP